jgi:hypothetical protein
MRLQRNTAMAEPSESLSSARRNSTQESSSGEDSISTVVRIPKQSQSSPSSLSHKEHNSLEAPKTAEVAVPSAYNLPQPMLFPSVKIFSGPKQSVKRKLLCSPLIARSISNTHIFSKKQKRNFSNTTPLPVNKHPQLWLPDGNAILQLEQTQFNLLRSRLVKGSPLFSTLFSQKSADGAGYRGVVVTKKRGCDPVYLLDGMKTSLKDVEVMLEIFDDGL